MWETLQRYRALDPESRRLFRRAAVLLPMIRASLRVRGYNKTFSSLQARVNPAAPAQSADSDAEQLRKTSRMVRAAVHHSLLHFTCLEESLGLWYLLRKQGIAPQLRIGVRKENGKFEAHAWVEHGGEALNQPEATHLHYAAFEKEFSEPPAERP
jgi:Transglutaminase-like superfamily